MRSFLVGLGTTCNQPCANNAVRVVSFRHSGRHGTSTTKANLIVVVGHATHKETVLVVRIEVPTGEIRPQPCNARELFEYGFRPD